MHVKVEPSGCCERKGLVQVRFCMYLDPEDYGYASHHIQMPVIPAEGYPGKVGTFGIPIDRDDYRKWVESLPKAWQNNPFHNHLIYVEPDATDKEIMNIGEAFLHEAYIKWACEQKLDLMNQPSEFPATITSARLSAIGTRVQSLKSTALERKI